ncbi:hypothetical protein [Secundilactobacillus silagei]|uniref:hypothetical protein n=1 Tax=Secundilactobacillus silagei TaxID=1293415 RepID=UPI00135647EE|nr:hypothetical protein [Secundilactobacillus silagei]
MGFITWSSMPQPAIWIASYGVNQPGVDNVQDWQYTNNGYQLKTDFNYDFAGILS